MNKIVLASILALGATQANATYLSAILGTNGADLTLEDNSREQWVDVDGNGQINAGDQLVGFLRFDAYSPPATNTNNDLYVTFSQTFGGDFAFDPIALGFTQYAGTFSAATLNFIDYTGATDYITTDLSGGVVAAIADIEANGSVAFTAGIVEPEDFFAFETEVLEFGVTDFVIDPSLTSTTATSFALGNFGAGLSIITNNLPVDFNRTIGTNFSSFLNPLGYGQGNLYDLAVINGNFGGICQNSPTCDQTVQGMTDGFVDNADVVINAVPEPTSLALLGLTLGMFGFRKKVARK